jgi:hypothetical protein
VNAPGDPDGIAAFAGSVVIPSPLAAVDPSLTALPQLSRAGDFKMTWTGVDGGTVTVVIVGYTPEEVDGRIECTVSSASGSLVVPASLLDNFVSGNTANVVLIVTNIAPLQVGNATVDLSAEYALEGVTSVQ